MPVKGVKKTNPLKKSSAPIQHPLRLRHWVMFWVLVAATYAAIIIIFSSVDIHLQQARDLSLNDQLTNEQLVAELQTQVQQLSGALEDIEAQSITPIDTPSSRECTVSKNNFIDNYVRYKNASSSLQVDIPFGSTWADTTCSLSPATWLTENALVFGPLVAFEGDSQRDSRLTVIPEITTSVKEKSLLQKNSDDRINNLRERTVSGMPVLSYTLPNEFGIAENIWLAIGRTFTYKISSFGWLADTEAIKIIQSLRVTK